MSYCLCFFFFSTLSFLRLNSGTRSFSCLLSTRNREVTTTNKPCVYLCRPVCVPPIGVTCVFWMPVRKASHKHTAAAGKCCLRCLLLPPDAFHHRAASLFLSRCSALHSSDVVDNRGSLQPRTPDNSKAASPTRPPIRKPW